VAFLAAAQRRGIVIERVPNDPPGQVDVDAVADRLDHFDLALVSLTHVPTNGGLVNPAADVGALRRRWRAVPARRVPTGRTAPHRCG